ncbi:hypothetical protein [Bradyrhizobium sp. 145]|uniref:hypothetical protein n=1 Tax=Bradyrhizobium sp. 145 TaxID=2782621 RepID=UPI001FFC0A61|nr:hypothetical protein [Bradyrhizobium sp. 145]MCK1691088.1 hypothetical protein [Bradyrhizobium sp. 145]
MHDRDSRLLTALEQHYLLSAASPISFDQFAPMGYGRRIALVTTKSYLKYVAEIICEFKLHKVRANFANGWAAALRDPSKSFQGLLRYRSTRRIPMALVSLACAVIDSHSHGHQITIEARANSLPNRQISRDKAEKHADDGDQPIDISSEEQRQLLCIVELLRYAEAEVSALHFETPAVLLGAAIAELAERLR